MVSRPASDHTRRGQDSSRGSPSSYDNITLYFIVNLLKFYPVLLECRPMETLGKLFGSEAKVKIIRLFLFNQETVFDIATIADRVKEDSGKVRREMALLSKISFVKRKAKRVRSVSRHGYVLNQNFAYLQSLQSFLITSKPLQPKEIIRKLSSVGTLKLLIVSGIFIREADSRADILIVADNIKKAHLAKIEIGRAHV